MSTIPCPACGQPIPRPTEAGVVITCEGCGKRLKARSKTKSDEPAQEPSIAPKSAPVVPPKQVIKPKPKMPQGPGSIQPKATPAIQPKATIPPKTPIQPVRPVTTGGPGATTSSRHRTAPASQQKSKTPLYIGLGVGAVAIIAAIIILTQSNSSPSNGGGSDRGTDGPGVHNQTPEEKGAVEYAAMKEKAQTAGATVSDLLAFADKAWDYSEDGSAPAGYPSKSLMKRDAKWAYTAVIQSQPNHQHARDRLGFVYFDNAEVERIVSDNGLDDDLKFQVQIAAEDILIETLKGSSTKGWIPVDDRKGRGAKWRALMAQVKQGEQSQAEAAADPWTSSAMSKGQALLSELNTVVNMVDMRLEGIEDDSFEIHTFKPYVILVQRSKSQGGEIKIARDTNTVLQELVRTLFDHFPIESSDEFQDTCNFIVVLRSADQYARYMRRGDLSAPIRSGAHFEPWNNRVVVYKQDGDKNDRSALFHEGTHQIVEWTMRNTSPGTGQRQALWFSEGIAEYFGGHSEEYREGKKIFVPGTIHEESVTICADAIERKDLIPLKELLSYSRADFNRDRGNNLKQRKTRHAYAQGWALFHYLNNWEKDKYQEKFRQYAQREFSGRSGHSTFVSLFGAGSINDIEAGYQEMIQELKKAVDEGRILNGRLQK